MAEGLVLAKNACLTLKRFKKKKKFLKFPNKKTSLRYMLIVCQKTKIWYLLPNCRLMIGTECNKAYMMFRAYTTSAWEVEAGG